MDGVAGLTLNYRDPQRTIRCVDHLLASGVAHVVVWDNSADDGVSADMLTKAYASDPRVTVEDSAANLGFAAGVNRGLDVCVTRLGATRVLLINNDADAPVELVGVLERALGENPQAVLAFPSLLHAGSELHDVYYHRWFSFLSDRPGLGKFRVPRGCCLMLATDRLHELLFDEDFFMYGEEVELGWRLRDDPRRMVHVPGYPVVHEGAASSRIGSPFYETRTARSHVLLASKLARGRFVRAMLYAARLPVLGGRAIVRSVRFRSLMPVRALWAALRQG